MQATIFGLGFIVKFSCIHGYYKIEEQAAGEVARFMNLFSGIEIVSAGEYFTFSPLLEAKNYSIKGNPYLGVTAEKTFAGNPWDVMRDNKLIYNFSSGKMEKLESVTQRIVFNQATNYFWTEGLILAGSLNDAGLRVTDFVAWFNFEGNKFKLSEASFD